MTAVRPLGVMAMPVSDPVWASAWVEISMVPRASWEAGLIAWSIPYRCAARLSALSASLGVVAGA